MQEDDQKRLADVDCLRDKCTIRIIVHADGGGWPTVLEITQQDRDPTKVPSLAGRITNDVLDIMGLDDETPRVKMSCEHFIGKCCQISCNKMTNQIKQPVTSLRLTFSL